MIELTLGFLLDLIIGDPQNPIHPIRLIGSLCKKTEEIFRSIFKKNLKLAGFLTWIVDILIVYFISNLIVQLSFRIHYILGILVSGIIIYFCIASKALKVEGLKVVKFLVEDDIDGARKQLSFIVGRDTKNLDREGILRAVIETIAENLSDGVIAPIFYVGLLGAPFALCYKAINTMDSMFGYKNEKYMDFGYFPAKLDDLFNYIPARLTGVLIILACPLIKLNFKNSYRIYKRDKNNHSSPNSAHPEAAVAGALGIKLGGDNYYFGKLVKKPTIGDSLREIEILDVYKTISILYITSFLGYIIGVLLSLI